MRLYLLFALLALPIGAAESRRISLLPGVGTTGPWHISRAVADVPGDASGPKLIAAPQPSRPAAVRNGSISVSFEINERGLPINIQIDKSSDKALDDEVIAMIREWRFEAALRGDVPLSSHAHVDLSIGTLPPDGRRPLKKMNP